MQRFKYYILNSLKHKNIFRLLQVLKILIILELYYYKILLSLYLRWDTIFPKLILILKKAAMVILLVSASNDFSFLCYIHSSHSQHGNHNLYILSFNVSKRFSKILLRF